MGDPDSDPFILQSSCHVCTCAEATWFTQFAAKTREALNPIYQATTNVNLKLSTPSTQLKKWWNT
jgi:hypothetical protein